MGTTMATTTLGDGTRVYCLNRAEAKVLDGHIDGYMANGIQVQPGDTIFDIGANIGLFGLRMAQQCDGDLRLFAFEPIPAIRACTDKNLEPWPNAKVLPCGISNEPGEARFTYYPNTPALSTAHPEDWDGQDGVLEEAVVGNARNSPFWYGKLVPRFLAGFIARWMQHGAIEVHCDLRTVSGIIEEHALERVDLLKIDCEGAELNALLGIADNDWPRIQQAVIEVHDVNGRLETITTLLRTHGLTQQTIDKEAALENTRLFNVYAHRPRD